MFNSTGLSQPIYLVSNGEIFNRLTWVTSTRVTQHLVVELRRTGLGLKGQENCDAMTSKLVEQWRPKFDIAFCGKTPLENVHAVLPARVMTRDLPINLREWLAKEFGFRNVGTGFEEAFFELHKITAPYEELDIDKVQMILEGELRRAGERVQFLGLTFPEHFIATWGMLIILVIHFYFWIQLQELRSRLRPSDPALNVAWVGLYTGKLPRLCSIVTAVLLPLGIAVYLLFIQPLSPFWIGILILECLPASMTVILLNRVAKIAAMKLNSGSPLGPDR